jgi:putative transposase
MMQSDPQIHHRRSIRLKGFDYTQPGAYFVTICTFQRAEIFGALVGNEIQLSPLGIIVQTEWFRSADIRKEICLFEDEFVVMPNHLHGIVWIVGADGVRPEDVRPDSVRPEDVCPDDFHTEDVRLEGVRPDGVRPDGVRPDGICLYGIRPLQNKDASLAPLRRTGRSLSSFLAGFKAVVTSRAWRELNSANIWQRNYYEHLIRNETELQNIRDYINTNMLLWQEDQLHPSALPNQFNQDTR